MTAPTFPPPRAITRSKVGRRLRDAYTKVTEAQRPHQMRGPATILLHRVWRAIEEAETEALVDIHTKVAKRGRSS